MTTFYHGTSAAVADQILVSGFRDAPALWGNDGAIAGIWVSNAPVIATYGEVCLRLTFTLLPSFFDDYQVVLEDPTTGPGYREWVLPANLINQYANIERYDTDGDTERGEPIA